MRCSSIPSLAIFTRATRSFGLRKFRCSFTSRLESIPLIRSNDFRIAEESRYSFDIQNLIGCSAAATGLLLNPDRGSHAMPHKTPIVFALVGALSCLAQQARAQNSSSVHEGGWPIQNGVKHQPTRGAVGGEFSRSQQEETDRLYEELMSNYGATHHSGNARMR
jgi:hypothetical protein